MAFAQQLCHVIDVPCVQGFAYGTKSRLSLDERIDDVRAIVGKDSSPDIGAASSDSGRVPETAARMGSGVCIELLTDRGQDKRKEMRQSAQPRLKPVVLGWRDVRRLGAQRGDEARNPIQRPRLRCWCRG